MGITDSVDSLRQRIQSKIDVPLSFVGQRALEAFLGLPGIEAWYPQEFYLMEVSTVFDVGLPFALIGDNDTVACHKQYMVNRLLDNKETGCSRWSEVLTGAVLCNWNGQVSFLRTRDIPTSDLEVRWASGPTISVEVTRAETRRTHNAVMEAIGTLAGAIQAGDFNWHLVCFFADASDNDDLNAVFEAVADIEVGQSEQVDGRWAIQAVPINRRAEIIGGQVVELFSPNWWPAHQAAYFSSSSVSANDWPVVYVTSMFPRSSYRNPVMRKADSGQRRENSPYLVALDSEQLPDAHANIKEDLKDYFSNWAHVSGVLVFDASFITGIRRKSLRVSLHVNPYATNPLPSQLTRCADDNRRSIDFEMDCE